MSRLSFGFRVLESPSGDRKICDADVAFAAYCACHETAQVDHEGYLSAFRFGDDFRSFVVKQRSTKGFAGVTWSPYLWFDIDRKDNLEVARTDTLQLTKFLMGRFNCSPEILIFFSGEKGFHIGLPTALFLDCEPSVNFHLIALQLAEQLAEQAGVRIDVGVYDRVRLFRAPNSRHPASGLHKVRVSVNDLANRSAVEIRKLASAPHAFEVPKTPSTAKKFTDWQDAAKRVAATSIIVPSAGVDEQRRTALNRSTLEFIRRGADTGDRHRLLFSAAANLAEFDCPLVLAEALLLPSALDSGLKPTDARRQISCGIEHVRGSSS